jgi:flagellar motility protein MotE (MotC chaperone)
MAMMKSRMRLLPILLGALALMLTVKIGALWHDLGITVGSATQAQTSPSPAPAPANATPANAQPNATPASATPAPQPTATQSAAATPPAANPPATPAMPAAQTPAAATPPATEPAPGAAATSPPTPDSANAIDPFNYTDQEVEVLQQLAKRRTELDARARALDEREALVAAAEQKMDQKMAELKALQSTLQGLLKQRSAAEEAQLQSLVKIYSNMKPKAAAAVFEELDMDVLLDVVSRMQERKSAPILALMSPTKAKELTFELAQRDQLPLAP